MARTFLPALRGKALQPVNYVTSALGPMNGQQKALIGDYLTTLVSEYSYGRRPRRWEVERAVHEGYERIVWVFRSVDAIAGNAAALPFQLLDKAENEVDDHPLLDLLNGPRANPLETGQEFRERLSSQVLLSRRGAFVECTYTRRNVPLRVDLLPPGRTQIIPGDKDDPIRAFLVTLPDGRRHYLDRDRVLWFRKPHPTDPFASMTPLEAAGLPIELDFFADLYNANFMRNDGRPGGILSVKGPEGRAPSDKEMDRIENRFGKGPVEAGKMSVISGDMTYVDPSAKPRDTHYADLSDRAKTKILTAFGLDESIVGDTSGRTFSNAEQAWENFWLLDPMPAHLRLVSNGWGRLEGLEDLQPGFDVSGVEPLRRARSAKLQDARAEVAAGLRTIKSYAVLAGYGDEIADTPHAHALWIEMNRIPIATREEDLQVLDEADVQFGSRTTLREAGGPAIGPDGQPIAAPPGQPVISTTGTAPAPAGGGVPRAAAPVGGAPQTPALPPSPQPAVSRSAADIVSAAGGKTRPPVEVKANPNVTRPRPRLAVTPAAPAHSSEADDETSRAAEDALTQALSVLSDRFIARTVARLQSPKLRKGTKHWQPEYEHDTRIGTKALDTAKAVDEDTWASDAQTVAQPYVAATATATANGAAADLDPEGHPILEAAVTAAAVTAVLDLIGESARRQARRLADVLNVADQAGQTLAQVVALAQSWTARLHGWARGLSAQATVAVIEGARNDAVKALIASGAIDPADVRRTWITRHDERVRPAHRLADGQTVQLGRPFRVGNALLRYPGDPLGPPAEVANCRCKVLVSVGVKHAAVTISSAA